MNCGTLVLSGGGPSTFLIRSTAEEDCTSEKGHVGEIGNNVPGGSDAGFGVTVTGRSAVPVKQSIEQSGTVPHQAPVVVGPRMEGVGQPGTAQTSPTRPRCHTRHTQTMNYIIRNVPILQPPHRAGLVTNGL